MNSDEYSLYQTVIPASLGICLALIFTLAICFCSRRIRRQEKKAHPEIPFMTATQHKPRAVKSPTQPSHYLKKSPTQAIQKPVTEALPAQTKFENENELKNTSMKSPELDTVAQDFGKLGTLVFKLRYLNERKALIVSISKIRSLVRNISATTESINSDQFHAKSAVALDPYVKLQLLPEKQHKVKTRVVRNSTNPIYDEDFTFYGLNIDDLKGMSLHFVVLSFDRYSRDDVIGEVVCPLNTLELNQIENQQVAYSREIQPRSLKIKSQGRGEILVSLCWQPAAARLTVVLLKARNLPRMDVTGLSDPYVKIYLLYNGQRIAKKKTHVKKRTLSPVFNESFAFDIPIAEGCDAGALDGVSIELMLLDWDRVTKNEVIGRLELGARSSGSALNHWKEVCNSPRRQIAEWHKLREDRDYYSKRDRSSKESSSKKDTKDYEKRKEISEKKSSHSHKDRERSDKKKSHYKERDRSYEREHKSQHRDRERDRKYRNKTEKKKHKERERSEERRSYHEKEKSKLNDRKRDNYEEIKKQVSSSSSSSTPLLTVPVIEPNPQSSENNLEIKSPSQSTSSIIGATLPSYYNPNLIDANKFAEQQKKRKLIWSNKESDSNKWSNLKFSHDDDGARQNKFMRLMGIKDKDTKESNKIGEASNDSLLKNMERDYEVARTFTHLERGRGFGFNLDK
ncbi:hypothetical protein PVAND_011465 [Polypedilum vanderplanki]|uniref:C2 domain-containing protein n=1 Tax=Polypedilum vanderplanki TaxID=319348 RepID=A0A9J6CK67_POLVA|nr:hypothetical protein PVAND_011465 [Polypedilum vanderplanki]